jgi:PIN domain nuclease of toxin-antitoxin system
VVDASAVLALLHGEDGADVVADVLTRTAAISLVNWAEVLSKVAEAGGDAAALQDALQRVGFLDGPLRLEPLTAADCVEVTRLRPITRSLGLSLADRACFALAARLVVPAFTADRNWKTAELGVAVQLIR